MKCGFLICWLSLSLSVIVCPQDRSRRFFLGIDGPVKTVRVEVATLTRSGELMDQVPRVLTTTDEVNEDGTMTVSRRYRQDGAVSFKQVTFYQADGRAKESQVYSDGERISTRMLYYYGESGNRMEMLFYGLDGNPRTEMSEPVQVMYRVITYYEK
jgi:hypothetical protein